MTQESTSGQAVAERVRAADIAVGGNSPVTAMLANSLKERKPLADTGELYDSVQSAVSAAGSFVFVPPRTFNESVTIDTAGLTLLGSGRATLINGGTVDSPTINITTNDVSVKTLSAKNNTDNREAIQSSGSNTTIKSVSVEGTGWDAIRVNNNATVTNCTITNSGVNGGGVGIDGGTAGIISSNIINEPGDNGIEFDDDAIVSNNIVKGPTGRNGIQFLGNDGIVIGNWVFDAGNGNEIRVATTDNIVANNRCQSISNVGTNTILDGNLTGASN